MVVMVVGWWWWWFECSEVVVEWSSGDEERKNAINKEKIKLNYSRSIFHYSSFFVFVFIRFQNFVSQQRVNFVV